MMKRSNNQRIHERLPLDDPIIQVKTASGNKVNAFVHNISLGGIQIRCSRLSANLLVPLGVIDKHNAPEVEISLNMASQEREQFKIQALCKLVYLTKVKDIPSDKIIASGLQFVHFHGKSNQALKVFIKNQPPS